jgi:cytochrome c oxidase cbb3-type subunit 2
MTDIHDGIYGKIDRSASMTVIGIILLFASAVIVTLIAPSYMDPSWTEISSPYQRQMYEVADPNIYISNSATGADDIQLVYHLQDGFTLLAFSETETVRILAPEALRKYVTPYGESTLRLTSKLMLLRSPKDSESFQGAQLAESEQRRLQAAWEVENPNWQQLGLQKPFYQLWELYEPQTTEEAFVKTDSDGVTENWVDEDYVVLDESPRQDWHSDAGVLYVNNPVEYRISYFRFGAQEGYKYDPEGDAITSVDKLREPELGFLSRQELISKGEAIYAQEGCWYCHTDQTRTLIQDTVLNGSDSYPAPPSSANEYVYQRVTFPGTRRIGPDISRVGIKRPSRDWHKSHFWSPKTASAGTIMPAFKHFFDDDPRGTAKSAFGVPNWRFEAIFQYLMTKGTRITAPTQAWWQGKDPIQTIELIERRAVSEEQDAEENEWAA